MSLWETIRSTISHPLVAGPLGGLIVVLLSYLDAKYRNIDREKDTYWKLGIVSALVIATLVYLVSEEYNKNDEFLNQEFNTELNESMMYRGGGFKTTKPYQPELTGPQENLHEMMNNLKPTVVLTDKKPEMPKPLFNNLKMEVTKVPGKHRSSRKSGRHKKYR
jgi:hypothetical protein